MACLGLGAGLGAGLGLGGCGEGVLPARLPAAGDAEAGRQAVIRVGCGACHVLPGVDWPQGRVGPSLESFAERPLIAGRFVNEAETLALWVRAAPALDPGTAMPAMPLTPREARDVAAYLLGADGAAR